MAVSATTSKVQYVGNNSAVTPYPVPFYFQDEAWLVVAVVDEDGVSTTLALGTDYSVTGAGDPNGGELVTSIAYDNTHSVTIYRVVSLTQLLDLVYNDRLPAALIERALDKLTYIAQQLAEISAPGEVALSFPATEPIGNTTTLPAAAARTGKVVYFNAITGEMELLSSAELALTADPAFSDLYDEVTAGLANAQTKPKIKAVSFAAVNNGVYYTTATATVTDPTPVSGEGYTVFVRDGTTTIDSVAYAVAGTIIRRVYLSGAWATYVYYTAAAIASLTQTLTNKTLTAPTINDYIEGVVAIGNSGTSKTISLTSGTVQTCTLTGNCTFTMPTATTGKSFVLYLKTGTGGFTSTFTGVKWPGPVTPVITTTASRMDIISFVADGTNWYGSITQNYTP
jgi:hypothetical protein